MSHGIALQKQPIPLGELAEMDNFLAQANASGTRLDPGEFTLNTLKAREKLMRHQLGDSGLWLVKLEL